MAGLDLRGQTQSKEISLISWIQSRIRLCRYCLFVAVWIMIIHIRYAPVVYNVNIFSILINICVTSLNALPVGCYHNNLVSRVHENKSERKDGCIR